MEGFGDRDDRVKRRFKLSKSAIQALECSLGQPSMEGLTEDQFVEFTIALGHLYTHAVGSGALVGVLGVDRQSFRPVVIARDVSPGEVPLVLGSTFHLVADNDDGDARPPGATLQ